MSTTHHMKMAKASKADINAAIELYQFLQAIGRGGAPSEAIDEFGYTGYGDLLERQAPDVEFLVRAHERGGLFRVVWGMQVLLDPANEVVDPNLPHLELHPKHEKAARERDELVAIARHVLFEGLTANHEPAYLIPSEKLRERLVELRAVVAAKQPKPAGGAS